MARLADEALGEADRAAGERQQSLDPLLPGPGNTPQGCSPPLTARGHDGHLAGFGVCSHQVIPDDSLDQSFGTATRFVLTPRLSEPDTSRAMDLLLVRWREHLSGLPEAAAADTAAMITWPSRDITGVQALLGHGMQPIEVIAARSAGRAVAAPDVPGVLIREAGPGDLEAVTEMMVALIAHEELFGANVLRPATGSLIRSDAQAALNRQPPWIWVAERRGRPIGLVAVQPPPEAAWTAGMTALSPVAYLQAGFVVPEERGSGAAAALVRYVHGVLDAAGIAVTLLHYAVANPRSGAFWARMGYRPLWTCWQARPAAALR
jgi:GNAT superfamily N-acetyltransferase